MKVLIAEKFQPWGIEEIRKAGFDVEVNADVKEEGLPEAIARSGCDVLLVRGRKVAKAALEASEKLGLVIRAGAGFNTIDIETAAARGIYVSNCPGKNAAAVAELTFGLILALDRRIMDAHADLKAGVWDKKLYSEARGLKGRTLGVIGMGQIGQLVAARALAFEMKVIAWSRSLSDQLAETCGVRRMASIQAVAAEADILSVHLAAALETKRCINAAVLGALKAGSTFINTARGEVVDYDALLNAIKTRQIRVGLDVFEKEPAEGKGAFKDRIVESGGIICGTPHVGASTDQAQDDIAAESIRILKHFRATGAALNCVNRASRSSARSVLVVRHYNRPGVLAHVLGAISHAGVNVEEMENVIYAGGKAACAQIAMGGELPEAELKNIREGHKDIIAASQKAVET